MTRGSRKPHTKSRNGCRQCKKRHIKCDGRGPYCFNCEKRRAQCEYADLTDSLFESSSTHPLRKESNDTLNYCIPSLMNKSNLPFHQLQIIHHWNTVTSSSIGLVDDIEVNQIWRITVPLLSQTCTFLMHSMLAFTAAHMAHLEPSSHATYLNYARRYHIQALSLFRSSVSPVNQSSHIATLTFIILTGLTTLGLCQEDWKDLDSFIDLLDFLRHSLLFATSLSAPSSERQIAAVITAAKYHPEGFHSLDEGLLRSLGRLESLNIESHCSALQKTIISQGIEQTRQWYSCVPLYPKNLVFIVQWVSSMSAEYFSLLKDKHPLALALLGHWILPPHNAPRKWYTSKWPQRALAAIVEELGTSSDLISWVVTEFQNV